VIELSHGPHRLGVAPEVGGAITHFRSVLRSGRQIDWMRPYVDRGRGPLDMASFVCLPFFSWLEKDRFEYQGLQVDLPPSGLGFERCLLGLGWTSVWQLSARGSDWLALEHHNSGGAWPRRLYDWTSAASSKGCCCETCMTGRCRPASACTPSFPGPNRCACKPR
jgi:galactose mutarotase-like enzyme